MTVPIMGFGTKNLLPNPGAQSATTGWTATGGAVTRAADASAASGFRLRFTSSTGSGTRQLVSALLTEDVAVGTWYTLTARLRGTSASTYRASLVFTDSSNNVLDTVTAPTLTGSGTSAAFVRNIAKKVAPSSTAKVRAVVEFVTNTSGDVFDIGGITLTPTSGAPGYFDGDSALATWTGTQYNSSSVQTYTSTKTPVVVDGYCLTTEGWAITNMSGRWSMPQSRGEDLTVSGRSGYIFEGNKPTGPGIFAWEVFVVGSTAAGVTPHDMAARKALFQSNMERLMGLFTNRSTLTTVQCWQPDGSVRVADVQFAEVTDAEIVAGGTRGVFGVAGTIPDVNWEDSTDTVQEFTVNANPFQADLTSFAGMTGVIEDALVEIVGPLTDTSITDLKSGVRVQRTGTTGSGATWALDCDESTSMVGVTDISDLTTHYGAAKFLTISNNSTVSGTFRNYPRLTVTGTGFNSATRLRVTARRKWSSA